MMEIPRTRKPSISLVAGEEEIASCASSVQQSAASQSVVPAPTSSVFPGDLTEMQILRLTLDLLNQKFWRQGPPICILTVPLADSCACLGLRIIGLIFWPHHIQRPLRYMYIWQVKKPFVFALWSINFTFQNDLLSLISLQSISCSNQRSLQSSRYTSNRFKCFMMQNA